jgi:hypothetical protein
VRLSRELGLENPTVPKTAPQMTTEEIPNEQREALKFSPGYPIGEQPLFAW